MDIALDEASPLFGHEMVVDCTYNGRLEIHLYIYPVVNRSTLDARRKGRYMLTCALLNVFSVCTCIAAPMCWPWEVTKKSRVARPARGLFTLLRHHIDVNTSHCSSAA